MSISTELIAQEPDPVLVFHQLADRAHPAVAEMVDVVDVAAPVLQIEQHVENGQDVLLAQRAERVVGIELEARIHLDPADCRQIVALGVEEQAVEQRLGGLQRRRLAGPHDAIDVDQRILARRVLVDRERIADIGALAVGTAAAEVDVEHRQRGKFGLVELGERRFGDLVTGLEINLAGFLVDQILPEIAADQLLRRRQHMGKPRLLQPARQPRRHALAEGELDFAGVGVDQVGDQLALVLLGLERRHPASGTALIGDGAVEGGKDLLLRHADGFAGLQVFVLALALRALLLGCAIVERQ